MRRGLVSGVTIFVALTCVGAAFTKPVPWRGAAQAPSAAGGNAVRVSFAIQKFRRQAGKLVAQGVATAMFTGPDGKTQSVQQPFTARVSGKIPGSRRLSGARRTCQVLFLQLDKLSLTLLGLNVNLDKVVLTINANSNGGALGSLFCKLAHTKVSTRVLARHLTSLARQSGLSTTTALGFSVPLTPSSAAADAVSCPVLDLILGPLNLRLLGLIVTLNQVHLTITADPVGGALGALFCALSKATVTGVP
jgi:hypothetical protein